MFFKEIKFSLFKVGNIKTLNLLKMFYSMGSCAQNHWFCFQLFLRPILIRSLLYAVFDYDISVYFYKFNKKILITCENFVMFFLLSSSSFFFFVLLPYSSFFFISLLFFFLIFSFLSSVRSNASLRCYFSVVVVIVAVCLKCLSFLLMKIQA